MLSVSQGDLLLGDVLDMDVDRQQEQEALQQHDDGKAEEQAQSPG